MRRGGGLPGRRVVGWSWHCSPMGLLGARVRSAGVQPSWSPEMTAGDSTRAVAGGPIHFLLASVLQDAMIIELAVLDSRGAN